MLYAKDYAGDCWNDDLGLLRFYHDRRGVTALEYALIGGLIMVVIVAGVTAYATSLGAWFTVISGRMAGI